MSGSAGCRFPERERLALDDAAGRLEGEPLARWEAHVAGCPECAAEAARGAAEDAALAEACRETPSDAGAARAAGGRRRMLAVAAAVVLAAGAGAAFLARSAGRDEGDRRARYDAAWAHVTAGRFPPALALSEELLAESRDRGVLFQNAFALMKLSRHDEAAARYREALAAEATPGPDGVTFADWYVAGHLAQALLGGYPGGEKDAEVERVVREDMAGPGFDRSLNRAFLWTEIARARALGRGDVEGGEAALRAAEAEDETYRREALAKFGREERSHYVLHLRFAFAEAVRADSEEGRRVARETRAQKERTAERLEGALAANYRADALESPALAEMLAARRGEPADLAAAGTLLREAMALREKGGNAQGIAWCRTRLAWLALLEGNAAAALRWSEEAQAPAASAGDTETVVDARLVRVQALAFGGRRDEAAALLATGGGATAGRHIDDERRRLTRSSLDAALSPDAAVRATARERVREASERSPLADVRIVARRALADLDAGKVAAFGPADLGFAP